MKVRKLEGPTLRVATVATLPKMKSLGNHFPTNLIVCLLTREHPKSEVTRIYIEARAIIVIAFARANAEISFLLYLFFFLSHYRESASLERTGVIALGRFGRACRDENRGQDKHRYAPGHHVKVKAPMSVPIAAGLTTVMFTAPAA